MALRSNQPGIDNTDLRGSSASPMQPGALRSLLTFAAMRAVFDSTAEDQVRSLTWVKIRAQNCRSIHTQVQLQAALWPWRADPEMAGTLVQIATAIRDACRFEIYLGWKLDALKPELFDEVPAAPRRKKPVKRDTLPLAGQGCTIEEFSRQVGWSATYNRRWFMAHPEDCSIAGHGEEMHRGPYRSLRISPPAREHFLAAHRPKRT